MRPLLLVAVIAFAAVFAWWLADDPTRPGRADEQPIDTDEPDIYAANIELTQFNPDGTLHYRVESSAIRQYNAQELTRMTDPRVHLAGSDQPPWDIAANHGYIRKRPSPAGPVEDVVYLREDVRMVQDHPANGLVTMRSEAFYIYPDRQFAETDQDVMIDTSVGRTRAGALVADLDSGRLRLSSGQSAREGQRVHTIVLPEQFKKDKDSASP